MKLLILLVGCCIALPAAAQVETAWERARKRCAENRGVDCKTKEGLREWLIQERPITKEEQQAAAAARRNKQKAKQ